MGMTSAYHKVNTKEFQHLTPLGSASLCSTGSWSRVMVCMYIYIPFCAVVSKKDGSRALFWEKIREHPSSL